MTIRKTHIIIASLAIIAVQALILYFLGRSLVCPCGYVKIWDGAVKTSQNSQHLFDWYSFSHLIYGFILYFAGWILRKKFGWPMEIIFLGVLLASVGWEIFENTQFVMHRFQHNTISFDYYGDSIINSISDTVCMAFGFWLAFYFPVWAIITLAIGLELLAGYQIHDNFLLNVIMFIHPLKTILSWQSG